MKPTAPLTLTLAERVAMVNTIRLANGGRGHAPADRDDERRWGRAWEAVDMPGAIERADGMKPKEMREAVATFEITIENVETWLHMPIAPTVELGIVLAIVRDKLDAARTALKDGTP